MQCLKLFNDVVNELRKKKKVFKADNSILFHDADIKMKLSLEKEFNYEIHSTIAKIIIIIISNNLNEKFLAVSSDKK